MVALGPRDRAQALGERFGVRDGECEGVALPPGGDADVGPQRGGEGVLQALRGLDVVRMGGGAPDADLVCAAGFAAARLGLADGPALPGGLAAEPAAGVVVGRGE